MLRANYIQDWTRQAKLSETRDRASEVWANECGGARCDVVGQSIHGRQKEEFGLQLSCRFTLSVTTPQAAHRLPLTHGLVVHGKMVVHRKMVMHGEMGLLSAQKPHQHQVVCYITVGLLMEEWAATSTSDCTKTTPYTT